MFSYIKHITNFLKFKICIILWLICSQFEIFSQVFYSTNPLYLKSKFEQNNLISNYKNNYPDTSITELSNFFTRNFMGNIGLPSPSYLFQYGSDNLGYRLYKPPSQNELFKENQIEYLKTMGPYANLTGIAGSKELQIFKMIFTNTYQNKLNFTLKFNRYSSQGFYLKQQSYVNNFFITSNYNSSNQRFGYYFFVLNNGYKNQENGGIKDVILNDSTLFLNKDLFSVKLSGAIRDNNETKVMLNPWIKLHKLNDTLNLTEHYLQLKSSLSFSSFKYKDANIYKDKFYNKYYLDSFLTYDSSSVKQFMNALNYTIKFKKNKTSLSFDYKNEINQIWQKKDSLIYNNILQFDFFSIKEWNANDSLNLLKYSLESKLNIQYILSGANNGNIKLESNSLFFSKENSNSNLFFKALFESRNPDYIYNRWVSNHFYWLNNNYKPQKDLQLKIGVNFNKQFNISLFYQNLQNYLYYDSLALPNQFNNSLSNFGLSINFSKVFFKHLGLTLNHIFQNTSNSNIIKIPQNITTAKLFYCGYFFNNNLNLQLGSQLQLYQSFNSYGYMPSTQVFYLQNKFQTQSYPFVDAYLNARIHPVSFFLKIENVLQSFLGNNYAFVPGYYQSDLAFRFGISWSFFD